MSKPTSKKLEELVCRKYVELQSCQRVASRLDMASTTVYRILIRNNVAVPERYSAENQQRKMRLQGEAGKAAAKDYASGLPMAELMAKYGVGQWAIRGAAKLHGADLRDRGGRRRIFTEEEMRQMINLYMNEGMSQTAIGAQFNCLQTKVSQLLRSAGCEPRGYAARGDKHGSWNGGKSLIHGYIAVLVERDDPLFTMAHGNGYALEHRLVMARALGRPLTAHETVHHIDGDRTNNRLSNLQLRFGKHGKGVSMVCAECGSHELKYVELNQ